MNILIPDSWLKEFLKTKATPKQIADCLSLAGPSVERVNQTKYGPVYSIEVTSNRVDAAGVYGIAREGAAILPRFGIKASLQSIKVANLNLIKKVKYLEAKVNYRLCSRFTAVLIRNVTLKDSPSWMKERLLAVGVRSINNVVDISNYIMHELGQPVHTFDYDKIEGAKMVLRESKKGEKLTTLDAKTHDLPGGDIVIEDGKKRLIDLAGIMGGENSAVDENTKNVLLFVQTYNPVNIRRTSMSLAHRSEAAVLFEKNLDPELVSLGVWRGIELFRQVAGGTAEEEILDLYPNPSKEKKLRLKADFISERLGVVLAKSEISKILTPLGFGVSWRGGELTTSVPSFRTNDIQIPEDIVEEVARIYGYHNLPSKLMGGVIPEPLADTPFEFEQKLKNLLSGWGGIEVYTLSLVSRKEAGKNALRLKNPLGANSEFLRTSLMPSLVKAAKENSGRNNSFAGKESFHLFELANVYLPIKGNLPNEKMVLAGIFANTPFREAKGIIESLLNKLNLEATFETEDKPGFLPSRRLVIKSKRKALGEFGTIDEDFITTGVKLVHPSGVCHNIYYEFEVEELRKTTKSLGTYKAPPVYPPQIEDLTFTFPPKTKIGEVISLLSRLSSLVSRVELTDTYKDGYTFRLCYQHPTKTLTDEEVEKIRNKILVSVKKKFGGVTKT